MIKKTTRIMLEDENGNPAGELEDTGGIPLSEGEIIHIRKGNDESDYEVMEKFVDCVIGSGEETVDITYKLRKKWLRQ